MRYPKKQGSFWFVFSDGGLIFQNLQIKLQKLYILFCKFLLFSFIFFYFPPMLYLNYFFLFTLKFIQIELPFRKVKKNIYTKANYFIWFLLIDFEGINICMKRKCKTLFFWITLFSDQHLLLPALKKLLHKHFSQYKKNTSLLGRL